MKHILTLLVSSLSVLAFTACQNPACKKYITYEQFGAKGDGVTDDMPAIAAAHQAANEKGLPVKAKSGKTYYIGKTPVYAEIRTDTDFGKASIIIDDVDFEQNAFVVTRKGGKDVILYFSDEVARAMRDYLDERVKVEALPGHEEAFFLSLQRRRITQRAVENMVKKYAAVAAPLKHITPHKLRSTFGTNLYRQTGDIYMVADVLGHSDVNTTRRHYAAIAEDNRRLAAMKTVLRDDG